MLTNFPLAVKVIQRDSICANFVNKVALLTAVTSSDSVVKTFRSIEKWPDPITDNT